MPKEQKYSIFIVDDEPSILRAFEKSLSKLDNYELKCFESSKAALKKIKTGKCHLLITDVSMPEMDGIELLKHAKEANPNMPVLVITGYGDIPMAVKAVKSGAQEFIEKPLDLDDFIKTINKTLDSVEISSNLNGRSLTQTELSILREIGKGKTNRAIADEFDRSVRTIENHRHRIMRKLSVSNTAELIKTSMKIGLVKK